jgi:multisubunit Na+/H+ antiporter MnhB subunit
VDPEFQRILIRVVALGGAILAIGAGALFIAFRTYGSEKKSSDFRAALLIGALLTFVMLACVLLLRLSFTRY